MNTKIPSIVKRAAGVAFLAGIATVAATAQELAGNVPVKFRVGPHSFDSGKISVAPRGNGMIVIRDESGAHSALALVGGATGQKATKHVLRFDTSDNKTYRLAGYCVANTGCFKTLEAMKNPAAIKETVEIALK